MTGTARMPGERAGALLDQPAAAADGQLIRTLTPELVDETCTSSARPEITARPKPTGIPASSAPWTRVATPCPLAPVVAPCRVALLAGAWSLTTTTNRSPWSVISILTGSAGQSPPCATA